MSTRYQHHVDLQVFIRLLISYASTNAPEFCLVCSKLYSYAPKLTLCFMSHDFLYKILLVYEKEVRIYKIFVALHASIYML